MPNFVVHFPTDATLQFLSKLTIIKIIIIIIIIIIITVYSQIHRKMKRILRRSSLSSLSPDDKISLEHKLYIIHQKIKELSIPYKTFAK